MSARPVLSVIIPAYNVADWLPATLEGLLKVVPSEAEIIVVDDGSADRTPDIAATVLRDVPNGVSGEVISVPNGGVAAARNFGLDRTGGDWIWFLDGDDVPHGTVDLSFVEKDTDVVVGGFYDGNQETLPRHSSFRQRPAQYGGSSAALHVLSETDPMWIGSVLVRRSLLDSHGIRFLAGFRQGEDVHWLIRVLTSSAAVRTLPSLQVCHVVRPGSATVAKKTDGLDAVRLMRALWRTVEMPSLRRAARLRSGREFVRTLRRIDYPTRAQVCRETRFWRLLVWYGWRHAVSVGAWRDAMWAAWFQVSLRGGRRIRRDETTRAV